VSTYRVSLGVLLAALCLVTLRAVGLAQTQFAQSAQPTFRSTLDLLTLETSVRDKSGDVVADLQASDFTVTIDGKPRKVVSAVFFKADAATGARLSGGAAPTPQYVSNDRAQPGRVVVFALDSNTIRGGQERALFNTASRMLDGLSAADAVGLVEIPGPAIDVTRDHSTVAEALKRFRGRARNEAEDIAMGRNRALMAATQAAEGQQVLLNLASLVRRLSAIRAPRAVILISGGLTFDRELLAQFKEVQRAAAESRVILYTVLLEQVGYEVSRGETRPDVDKNPAKAEGLATIGSMTGGMFFNAAGKAAGIFDRIQSEVTSFYQLAIESSPADADGKEHDVKVRVNRNGLDVRAPAHVAVSKPPKIAPLRDRLAEALQQPTDVPDVPLAVSTYSTHAAGGAINVVVSAEIGAPGGAAPAEWGLAIRQTGKDPLVRRSRIPAGSKGPQKITTTMEVPPGDYRLRAAAVDAEGHIGVLEIAVTAGYQKAGAARLSDIIVGAVTDGKLEPRRRIAQSEQITALLQVMAESDAGLGGTLELIPGGSARAVFRAPFAVRPAASAGAPVTLETQAPLTGVPPGRYTAVAVLNVSGQPMTRVDRVIEITGTAPVTTPADVVASPVSEAAATVPAPAAAPAAATPSASSSDELIRRAGAYVESYGGQASLLVGVEHYSQTMNQVSQTRVATRGRSIDGISTDVAGRRRLVSEFALMPNAAASGGWLGYRDVIEVDGKPVADRGGRLQALFRSDTPDLQAARKIADEGARYNIGSVSRNFNVPTTTLFFMHPGNLSRFTFRRTGRDRIDGVDTVVIEFHEERTPTLIMNRAGKDVPASGTVWVNPVDGVVIRTRLELQGFDDVGSKAIVDVVYRKDPAVGMWVPSRMTERYTSGAETTTTDATYSNFKRFQTSVKIK